MKAYISIFAILSISALLFSCDKYMSDEHDQNKEHPIGFSLDFSASPVDSKAFLYDETNIIQDGQGDFSVIAYQSGSKSKHFLQPERVSYWFNNWVFYDAAQNKDYKRYWPQTYALDFFAFMPYDLTGSNVSVDHATQQFSCTIPQDKAGQDSAKEFIYAFETGKRYTESNKGKVDLVFRHPFAVVNFVLLEAHGNTVVHNVGLKNMSRTGVFDIPSAKWAVSNEKSAMTIDIGKTVGAGLQLNSLLGGPYLVLPQSTDGINISVNFTWNSTEPTTGTGVIGSGKWEPGHIYTYKLNLGDADEDIIADVSVTPWEKFTDENDQDYKHEIEVE